MQSKDGEWPGLNVDSRWVSRDIVWTMVRLHVCCQYLSYVCSVSVVVVILQFQYLAW